MGIVHQPIVHVCNFPYNETKYRVPQWGGNGPAPFVSVDEHPPVGTVWRCLTCMTLWEVITRHRKYGFPASYPDWIEAGLFKMWKYRNVGFD